MAGDHQATNGTHPDMDYAEHNGTYDTFVRFTTIGTIATLCIVLTIGFAYYYGRPILGLFFLLATLGATGAGIMAKGLGHRPVAWVLGLMMVLWFFIAQA